MLQLNGRQSRLRRTRFAVAAADPETVSTFTQAKPTLATSNVTIAELPYDGGVPDFETFTRRMVPLTKAPFVTIQKRGTISMNKVAMAAMGNPQTVELLYDRKNHIVGFRPVDPSVEHAYAPRGVGSATDPTTYIVAAAAFARYYAIDTSVSRRWHAYMDGDVLCVDLKTDGTIVTSNRSSSRDDAAADDVPLGTGATDVDQ